MGGVGKGGEGEGRGGEGKERERRVILMMLSLERGARCGTRHLNFFLLCGGGEGRWEKRIRGGKDRGWDESGHGK